ncbi:MAG: DUF5654 family protein [Patescibacteria group bacterium]
MDIQQNLEQEEKQQLSLLVEVLEKVNTLATAGFGLVAALAWNDAIHLIFERLFPEPGNGIGLQLLYAIFVTIVVVVVTLQLARYTSRIKERMQK